MNTPLAKSINEIDNHNSKRLSDIGIPEERWVKSRIADRLSFARNPMVHGEAHHFYYTGAYLTMLYILFYLHDQKENVKYG